MPVTLNASPEGAGVCCMTVRDIATAKLPEYENGQLVSLNEMAVAPKNTSTHR
jgi:hypothetical protein